MKFVRDLVPDIDDLPSRKRESHLEMGQDDEFWEMYEIAKKYSLLHVTGFWNLYRSIKYLSKSRISGDFVEFGCFLGGAAIFMGLMRRKLRLDASILLFDTFEGAPVGSEDMLFGLRLIETPNSLPNYFSELKDNISTELGSTEGYSFIVGRVEDTLPQFKLPNVSLARLDTDFYDSTKLELELVYPKLVGGGVLIIDDYGMFAGSRKATDEYFENHSAPPLLNRIDHGICAGVKPMIDSRSAAASLDELLREALLRVTGASASP